MKRYCPKRQQATAPRNVLSVADRDTLPKISVRETSAGIFSRSGQQVLRSPVSPADVTLVSAFVNKLVTGTSVQMMMDSGSSVSQEVAIKLAIAGPGKRCRSPGAASYSFW